MTTKDSRRKDRIMSNLMRGSDEYYKNHPDQPKEIFGTELALGDLPRHK